MIAGIIAGTFGILFAVLMILIAVAATIFWIWMLIHALTNRGLAGFEKLVWVLVILFLHGLGALIYFFVGRKESV